MTKTLKSKPSYELEHTGEDASIVHFSPENNASHPRVNTARRMMLIALFFGWFAGLNVAVLLGYERGAAAVWTVAITWGVLFAAGVALMVKRAREVGAPGSLHTTIRLSRDALRLAGEDTELDRAGISEVCWCSPDGTYSYRTTFERNLKDGSAKLAQETKNSVQVACGSKEIDVIPGVLSPRQANDIAGLIERWRADPDAVLQAA